MAKAKEYELKIIKLPEFEGFGFEACMTKGHHDKAVFAEKILKQHGYSVAVEEIEHCYGMFIPYIGTGSMIIHKFKEPTKRSFPMTYIDI